MFAKTCTRMFIHSSTVINRSINCSTEEWKNTLWYVHKVKNCTASSESAQTIASCSNTDKSHKHYVDNMKPNAKGSMLCDSTYIMGRNGQN